VNRFLVWIVQERPHDGLCTGVFRCVMSVAGEDVKIAVGQELMGLNRQFSGRNRIEGTSQQKGWNAAVFWLRMGLPRRNVCPFVTQVKHSFIFVQPLHCGWHSLPILLNVSRIPGLIVAFDGDAGNIVNDKALEVLFLKRFYKRGVIMVRGGAYETRQR